MTINLLHLAVHFKEISVKIKQFLDVDAPRYAGNVAVGMFKRNYATEGFFGKKWKLPRRRDPCIGGYYIDARGKRRKVYALKHDNQAATRRVLHGATGNLKRSISPEPSGRGQVTIYSDSKYGRRHNEGLDGMPRRQFIGEHPQVTAAVKKEIESRLDKIFNPK